MKETWANYIKLNSEAYHTCLPVAFWLILFEPFTQASLAHVWMMFVPLSTFASIFSCFQIVHIDKSFQIRLFLVTVTKYG